MLDKLRSNVGFQLVPYHQPCWFGCVHPVGQRCQETHHKCFVKTLLAKAQVNRSSCQAPSQIPGLGKGFDAEPVEVDTAVGEPGALMVDKGQQG